MSWANKARTFISVRKHFSQLCYSGIEVISIVRNRCNLYGWAIEKSPRPILLIKLSRNKLQMWTRISFFFFLKFLYIILTVQIVQLLLFITFIAYFACCNPAHCSFKELKTDFRSRARESSTIFGQFCTLLVPCHIPYQIRQINSILPWNDGG